MTAKKAKKSPVLTIVLVLAALLVGVVIGRLTADFPKKKTQVETEVETETKAANQDALPPNGTMADDPEEEIIGTKDDLIVNMTKADIKEGTATVTGTLTNTGDATFGNVNLIASFKNEKGEEITTQGYTYERITPGEEAEFTITASNVDNVKSCDVIVESFSTF